MTAADETGCCNTCKGTGRTYTPETGGMCADCRGTGHPHEGVCAAAWADRFNQTGSGNIPLGAEWCQECGAAARIVDEFEDEQIIPDRRFSGPPSFRAYHVTILDCGHQIAWEMTQ